MTRLYTQRITVENVLPICFIVKFFANKNELNRILLELDQIAIAVLCRSNDT